MSRPGFWASKARIVPPQPISMSSLCAPRQRMRRRGVRRAPSETLSMTVARRHIRHGIFRRRAARTRNYAGARGPVFPNLPRRTSFCVHIVELLLVLEGVHGGEETIIVIPHDLLFLD